MKLLLIIVITICIIPLQAYDWQQYCAEDYPIYQANFQFPGSDILCSEGLLIRRGLDWELYDYGLPIQNAISWDEENLLLCQGNGSGSDGAYSFNILTNTFELIAWFNLPNFLIYNEISSRFYLGCEEGLYRSFDGNNWLKDSSPGSGITESYSNYGNNLIMGSENGIYNWQYSSHPDFANRLDLGLIELAELDEASGLVASRINPNVFWTINDSGGEAAVYAFNSSGQHLGIYFLDGVTNRDWEDLAIGGGPDNGQYLYIADIGDNSAQYDSKFIYRIEEPAVFENQEPAEETITEIEIITVQYPQDNYDAETLMHDPLTNDLYLVTKRLSGAQGGVDKVFRAGFPQSTNAVTILEEIGELDYPASLIPFSNQYAGATGGDISPLGDEILIKTYSHVYHWKRNQNQTWAELFQNDYEAVNYIREPQGEAICWEPLGNGYFTTSEEPISFFPAHLYFYELNSWQMVSESASLKGFTFDQSGTLYGFIPGESTSSGLYKSEDLGDIWTPCFLSSNLSSLALPVTLPVTVPVALPVTRDSNDNIMVGWSNMGVGLWNQELAEPQLLNLGLDNLNILDLVNFPNIDSPSILACTQSGAYYVTEYLDSGPNISTNLTSLVFNTVEPGYSDTLSLEIFNEGGNEGENPDLNIYEILDAPASYFNFISISDSIISPDSSTIIRIEFAPLAEGIFSDTLYILSNAYNSATLPINMSGEAGTQPAKVNNLAITLQGSDAVLSWLPVTTTINGNPTVVDGYLVYYSASPDSAYYLVGLSTETTYTHQDVAQFSVAMFYKVSAYVGNLRFLDDIIAKQPIDP